jgi:2',3'-cyclic-nucleotide 2'-phosphodiesterase (5'-nucleotidase family)
LSLHILYTNDLHNHTAPLARLGEFRDNPQSLLLDAGDALRGSNTAWRWSEPVLDWMRRLGYRAMAMGNREFHYFRWVQRWREQEREFPLLACNLEDLRMPQWGWRRYLRFPWNGLRVAVIGATPVQYPLGSRWERLTGFRFLDPLRCIPPLVEELRPQADALLLLSHLGLQSDLQLAELGLPIDLILGGHSHDLTPEPVWRGKVPVVQGGANGRFLGELRLDPGQRNLECRFHACG